MPLVASTFREIPMSALAVAKASLKAYVDKDRSAIEALLADDFRFTSPLDHAHVVRAGRLAEVEVYFGWNLPHPVPVNTHADPDKIGTT